MYKPESAQEQAFLDSYDPSKFPIITVTVDVIALHRKPGKDWKVLLIERGNWPYKGSWALPGGFIDETETAAQAAARELMEETHWELDPIELEPQEAASEPNRDPRGRCISLPYLHWLKWDGKPPAVKPGDDAAKAQWFKLKDAMQLPLAFDHKDTLITTVSFADRLDKTGYDWNPKTWERIKEA